MITNQIKKNIISELGIEKLPPDKAEEIIVKLEENIQRQVVLEVLDLLNEEDQKKISALIEANDNEKISVFLLKKIPTINSLIKAVAGSVVKEFKNSVR